MDQTIRVGAPSADLWITIGATAGFNIHCETTSATHDIALIIAGVPA